MKPGNLVIAILFALLPLSACSTFAPAPAPTPDIQHLGVHPHLAVEMPFLWDCSEIQSVSTGIMWRDIQIGKTTFDEMVEIVQPDLIFRTTSLNRIVFEMKDHKRNRHGISLSVCFLGNILSAFEIYGNTEEFPWYPGDLFELYGVPDRVTWGHNAANRTMIWAERGLMANIERIMGGDVAILEDANRFFLFPPINARKLEESWIMKVVPGSPAKDQLAKMPPEWQVEDPWGYNDD